MHMRKRVHTLKQILHIAKKMFKIKMSRQVFNQFSPKSMYVNMYEMIQ